MKEMLDGMICMYESMWRDEDGTLGSENGTQGPVRKFGAHNIDR